MKEHVDMVKRLSISWATKRTAKSATVGGLAFASW
jgi:hypothetical protein